MSTGSGWVRTQGRRLIRRRRPTRTQEENCGDGRGSSHPRRGSTAEGTCSLASGVHGRIG